MTRLTLMAACLVAALGATSLAAAPESQTKVGTIKSVDAKARTFFMDREPRGLTFTVDDHTTITLAGKPSTFADAIKPEAKVAVTYSINGETRLASKVEVASPSANAKAAAAAEIKPPETSPAAKPADYEITRTYKIAGYGESDAVVTLDPEGKILCIPEPKKTTLMDAATGKILGTLTLKGPARAVALVPDAGRGFITNGTDNTVTVFDLKTYAILGTIPMEGNPGPVIYDAAGKRVLVCCTDARILVPVSADINLKTGKPDAAIELAGQPTGLVSDGQGSAYVSLFDSDEIAVIDTKARSLLTKWPLGAGARPVGIAMDPSKGWLFVALIGDRMSVVSTVDGREIDNVPLRGRPESAAFGGGKAFVMCTDGNLAVIAQNAAGRYELQQKIKTVDFMRSMAVDPKTGTAYVLGMDLDKGRLVMNSFRVIVLERK